jgi:predicted phosphodiesterase
MRKNIIANQVLIPVFILFLTLTINAKVLMHPYLQAPTGNSIIVMVETDSKDDVVINYSKDNTNKSMTAKTSWFVNVKEKKNVYVHRIVLNNLEPGNNYTYTLKDDGKTYSGTFISVLKEGSSFKFAVMGDCRSNPDIHSVIAKEITKHSPLLSVYTGDLCYDGKYKSWKKEFFTDAELNLDRNVPFVNSLGNHEGSSKTSYAFLQGPNTDISGSQNYYSFDYGDIHFLVLNSEESIRKGSPQYKFAEKDLQSTNKKWKIAVLHQPIYCAGGHGENKSLFDLSNEIFEKNNVSVVLSGHSHFYQRNLVGKICHLVVGGGGAPLYSPKEADYVKKSAREYHYAIVDASPKVLKFKVYDIYGKILDEFEISK